MNKDMAQFELDDEALDSVNGGVGANQNNNCDFCDRIDKAAAPSCANCNNFDGGNCPFIS